MEPFQRVKSSAIALLADDIDTDQIVPARFLKSPRDKGYGTFLFHDQRFDGQGAQIENVFNDPVHADSRILIAAANFGCGSSREGAVYALFDYGFRVIIAASLGDIFRQNCLKNGLLPIVLPADEAARLRELVAANPRGVIDVDLVTQSIACFDGRVLQFSVDPFWKEALLKGTDELGLTLGYSDEIKKFEAGYYEEFTWLA